MTDDANSDGGRQNRIVTSREVFSSPMLATLLLYVGVDLAICARHIRLAAAAATIGFILMSAAVLTGVVALVLQVAIAMRRQVPHAITRALGATVVAWYPAHWLASVITSGSGISRSIWAPVLRGAVLVSMLVAAAITAGALPIAHNRLSIGKRRLVGGVILLLGLGALVITSYYATTYVRAYRGILVVSALLLELGFLVLVGKRFGDGSAWRARRLAAVLLMVILALGFVLSRVGGVQRAYASYTIFSHTLVAQKLQALLLRASPVFRATSRVDLVDLGSTRLAPNNPVPVPSLAAGRYSGNNVLFVTFDALRADVVTRRFNGHDIAPSLKALATDSVFFRNAIANYSHTSRSILSILAASWEVRFPSDTHVSTDPIDVRARTRLPRLLRRAGYESVAIMISGQWGDAFFDARRFPEFDRHIAAGEHCESQVAAFEKYLRGREDSRPFWAWIHMFDTHAPVEGAASDQLFGKSAFGGYAAGVHRGDRCVGALLSALQRHGAWNRTIVVVTADHGEALGEHGRTHQHSTCYWHDIHIPLLIRLPDYARPKLVDFPIQPADLVPTLANLLGIPVDEPEVDGDDLSGVFDEDPAPTASSQSPASMAFTQGHLEQYECASVVSLPWHLIYTEAARTYELYNLDMDPHEVQNLVAERPDVLDLLRPVIDTFRGSAINLEKRESRSP